MEPSQVTKNKQIKQLVGIFTQEPALTTLQYKKKALDMGIANPSARMSEANKLGFKWDIKPIPGSTGSLFTYKGWTDPAILQPPLNLYP